MQIRCPYSRHVIKIVQDSPLLDVECPSCASSFSLLGDTSTTRYDQTAPAKLGTFDLLEPVGTGAFGTVWKARDAELDREVAVKIPRKEHLSPTETEQFLREARSAAQLKHPNIVSVHEVGREGDTVYIVSNFILVLTLSDWLSGQRPTYPAPTRDTPVAWSDGCGSPATGHWRSSTAPRKGLWSCPNAWSWNAPSPSWGSTVASRKTTRFLNPPVKHSSTSP